MKNYIFINNKKIELSDETAKNLVKQLQGRKPYNELTYDEKLAYISLYAEESKKDEDWCIRQEAYRVLGYTEEALKDKHYAIRQETYKSLGYTEEAKRDEDWIIRRAAYRVLGYTKEAFEDEYPAIRKEAKLYFKIK